jgi:hypothetical protein
VNNDAAHTLLCFLSLNTHGMQLTLFGKIKKTNSLIEDRNWVLKSGLRPASLYFTFLPRSSFSLF